MPFLGIKKGVKKGPFLAKNSPFLTLFKNPQKIEIFP